MIYGKGSDSGGSAPYTGAKITFAADGTWDTGTNYYYPTAIKFYTQQASGTDNIAAGPRMTLDSSGNVGIGIASPTAPLSVDETGAAIKLNESNVASDTYVDMRASSAAFGYDSSKLAATIQAGAGNKFISFNVNNNTFGSGEAARLDSSGNLLVAKTSTGIGTVGHQIQVNGVAQHVADGANPLQLNRKTSNGSIIDLRKDGTTVGSIGAVGDSVYIASPQGTDAGLQLGNSIVGPATTNGSNRDNAIDLG